jgi:hypothetical protein
MKRIVVLISVLVSSACGGDSADDSVDALCNATCTRKAGCGTLATGATKDSCFAACKANGEKMAPHYKPGFLSSLTSCIPGVACDASDDQCLTQANAKINPNWTTDPDLLACIERARTCNASGTGFSDDYCNGLIYLTTTTATSIKDCLKLECGSIKACLRTVIN